LCVSFVYFWLLCFTLLRCISYTWWHVVFFCILGTNWDKKNRIAFRATAFKASTMAVFSTFWFYVTNWPKFSSSHTSGEICWVRYCCFQNHFVLWWLISHHVLALPCCSVIHLQWILWLILYSVVDGAEMSDVEPSTYSDQAEPGGMDILNEVSNKVIL